jgi:hypothetical protein
VSEGGSTEPAYTELLAVEWVVVSEGVILSEFEVEWLPHVTE